MAELSIDFESRSKVNLKKTSVYPYAAHPSTDLWCMAYAFGDEEDVGLWVPRDAESHFTLRGGLPLRIIEHILNGGYFRAWNVGFERVMWREIMVKRYGALPIADDRWLDTAAEAAAMALPRSLDGCADVLGVKEQKDDDGHRVMMQMAKPRKPRKGEPTDKLLWWDTDEKKQTLFAYCKQDVRTERAVKKALRRLNASEQRIFLLDAKINDRGVPIDLPLVDAAQRIVDTGRERANAELSRITGGVVNQITKHADLTEWLCSTGVETDSVAKKAVAELLEGELPPEAREALELRADAGRSSLAKLTSIKLVTCEDSRARGLHLYHAASTGRWGGKHIQTQNFPRGEVADIESFIPDVLANNYEGIDLIEHPLVVISSMLRSMIAAPEGFDLMAGDFSAVEARVLNWVAGQDDILDLFRAMDAGDKTRHPYKVMAVKMGRAASADLVKKPSEDYQAGKAAELGCGFQMGAEKFVRAAWDVYQLRVTDEQAAQAVKAYRATHPMVVNLWYDIERAVKQAVGTPGAPFRFGSRNMLTAIVAGAYLYIVLPSGRPLMYAAPKVFDAETSWGAIKPTIHYKGVNPNPLAHGTWEVLRTYGGHLVENVVQGVARDLLAEAMLRLEARGYPVVMHVHDEAVAEVPQDFGSVKEFESIMSQLPAWATGCPIAAEAWRGHRYRK
jgi:DNA polymerase